MSIFQSCSNPSEKESKENLNHASLKARKTLSINGWKENQPSLDLNKRTIQTILKKHKSKKFPERLLVQKKSLRYGVCSQSLRLYEERKLFTEPQGIHGIVLIRHQRRMMNSRNIQIISMDSLFKLPLKLLRTFQVLRNLQSLSLRLTASQFLLLSRQIKENQNLRQLSVTLKGIESDEESFDSQKAEHAITTLLKGLLGLKHLTKLNISLGENDVFNREEVTAALFKGLGLLNLSDFGIALMTPNSETFNANEYQEFFGKIESLLFDPPKFFNHSSFRRNLVFKSNEDDDWDVTNKSFISVLTRCSSLQYLLFDPQALEYNIPVSFGLAKNLKSIECPTIDLQFEEIAEIERLEKLFSQAEKLEHFKFTTNPVKKSVKFIIPIHRAFEQSCLKYYSLVLTGTVGSYLLEPLCKHLSKIKTLEKIDFYFSDIEDIRTTQPIFKHFPKLKQLHLEVLRTVNPDPFPAESLAALESIEELEIVLPSLDKEILLQKLPKLPCLKRISIGQFVKFNRSILITIEDYKNKFSL